MRADSNPDRPLTTEEAQTWAGIESSLREDLNPRGWRPLLSVRQDGAVRIGVLVAVVGGLLAGLSTLPAQTVAVLGLTVCSGGLGLALSAVLLRVISPVMRRRQAAKQWNTSSSSADGLTIVSARRWPLSLPQSLRGATRSTRARRK